MPQPGHLKRAEKRMPSLLIRIGERPMRHWDSGSSVGLVRKPNDALRMSAFGIDIRVEGQSRLSPFGLSRLKHNIRHQLEHVCAMS